MKHVNQKARKVMDALTEGIVNKEEAKAKCLPGWNIRCNLCGSYGAEWVRGERPGWGSLALCPKHKAELIAEKDRHEKVMRRLTRINFEQDERSFDVIPKKHT